MKKVIIYNEERQFKLEDQTKKKEETLNKTKLIAIDKSRTDKLYKDLQKENDLLHLELNKIQNYDEIHIEIDMLSMSSQGVNILKKKYGIII